MHTKALAMLLGCVVAGTITTQDSSSSAGVGSSHSPHIGTGVINSHASVYNHLAGKVTDLAGPDAQHNIDSAHDRDCLLEQEDLCDDCFGKLYT